MATLAVFIALGGVSYAVGKSSIGSREIQNNAVRGVDVRDGDLTAKDFALESLPSGQRGPTGPQGVAGAQGATGPQGETGFRGATGPRGLEGTTGDQGPAGFSATTVATLLVHTPASTTEIDTIDCPGTHPEVTGGGYEISAGYESFASVVDTHPTASGAGWAVRMKNLGNTLPLPYTIWAVCVQ